MSAQLPTRAEVFRSALRELDHAYDSLNDSRGALRAEWAPLGAPLPAEATKARGEAIRQIVAAEDAINAARAALAAGLDELA
jgi:hypothetical protein